MSDMDKAIFFFIGTEAELIKLFPVMLELKNREKPFKLIASGQNDISESIIFKETGCGNIDLELSQEKRIRKSTLGLMEWWTKTYRRSIHMIQEHFSDMNFRESLMVVHGDTISTYMGARIGQKLGMNVCHIEAGLRSHHLFNPFPEEIDRLLTSRIAKMHFAPGKEAALNLRNVQGKVIDTKQNTLLDSLRISRTFPVAEHKVDRILASDKRYFIFVIHRQENLANKKLVIKVVNIIEEQAKKRNVVIILHAITTGALVKYGLFDRLRNNKNIILLPRIGYFDFMKLLEASEFVITDGGSNQEELFYMGKPTLILRKTTERKEGIGKNAKLYQTMDDIQEFADSYDQLKQDVVIDGNPSMCIADELLSWN